MRTNGGDGPKAKSAERSWLLELAVALALSLSLIFFVVRPYIAEVFVITADSMAPTLVTGDRVLANKLAYRLGEPKRGDVVAFRSSNSGIAGQVLVKRVVATAGDTVEYRGGILRVGGESVEEPYVRLGSSPGVPQERTRVPEGTVFVMGDNRQYSMDSRDYGPIAIEDLEGKVEVILWPIDHFGRL